MPRKNRTTAVKHGSPSPNSRRRTPQAQHSSSRESVDSSTSSQSTQERSRGRKRSQSPQQQVRNRKANEEVGAPESQRRSVARKPSPNPKPSNATSFKNHVDSRSSLRKKSRSPGLKRTSNNSNNKASASKKKQVASRRPSRTSSRDSDSSRDSSRESLPKATGKRGSTRKKSSSSRRRSSQPPPRQPPPEPAGPPPKRSASSLMMYAKKNLRPFKLFRIAVFAILVGIYLYKPAAITKLHKDTPAIMRALPLVWLAASGLPTAPSAGRFRVHVMGAFLAAALGEVGLQMKRNYFVGGMLLHAIAYLIIVGGMGIRPFGKIYTVVSTFLVTALVYLYVSVAVPDNTIKLCLTFQCIAMFLMLWRSAVLLMMPYRKTTTRMVFAGCVLLALSEVVFMFASYRTAIVKPTYAVPLTFYGGMLALELAPML